MENLKKEHLVGRDIDQTPSIVPAVGVARLWSSFRGRRNSDDLLVEKGRLLATVLCKDSLAVSKRLIQKLGEQQRPVDDARLWPVSVEVIFFLVHYVDRLSYVLLGNDRQRVLLEALVAETREILAGAYQEGEDAVEFRAAFPQWQSARQTEYLQYKKMLPEDDESPEQTLFWEVEKKIAEVLGFDNDRRVMLVIGSRLIRLIEVLDLGGLLADCQSG